MVSSKEVFMDSKSKFAQSIHRLQIANQANGDYLSGCAKPAMQHIYDGVPDLFSVYHAQYPCKCRFRWNCLDSQFFYQKFFLAFCVNDQISQCIQTA